MNKYHREAIKLTLMETVGRAIVKELNELNVKFTTEFNWDTNELIFVATKHKMYTLKAIKDRAFKANYYHVTDCPRLT